MATRNAATDDESVRLVASLRQQGEHADAAICAFSGMYPFADGLGSWSSVFTKHRAITFHDDHLSVWRLWTGLVVGPKIRDLSRTH